MTGEVPKQTGLAGRRVAVTGASGFIGRRLVEALIESGARVRLILRDVRGCAALASRGVDVVRADLFAGPPPPGALRGADVLFHLAYDVRASGARNLDAFSGLYDVARDVGVGRLVHASSIVVHDAWPDGTISPDSPASGEGGGDYRQAKIAMERRIMGGVLRAAVLRPTIVYGPGSSLWTLAPIARLRQGPVILPRESGLCPAVHVDDVVADALRAAVLPDLGREAFIDNGPNHMTWVDFYEGYRALVGRGEIRLLPAEEILDHLGAPAADRGDAGPGPAARLSAVLRRVVGSRRFEAAMTTLRERVRRGREVWPDHHLLAHYLASPRIDDSATRRRLGVVRRIPFAEGLAMLREH